MTPSATGTVAQPAVEATRRAIVGVQIKGSSGPPRGWGFVVDPAGLVVTSSRFVQAGTAVEVALASGQRLPVVLIARDPLSDVAVLKVQARDHLPTVSLGESRSLRVGDAVVAVGSSAEEGDGGVATGMVTATGVATGGDLALDFSPRPERTGSPVLNVRGEVVGMSAWPAGTSSSVAVPVDRIRPLLREVGQAAASRAPVPAVIPAGSGR